jgi:hypothetical protein
MRLQLSPAMRVQLSQLMRVQLTWDESEKSQLFDYQVHRKITASLCIHYFSHNKNWNESTYVSYVRYSPVKKAQHHSQVDFPYAIPLQNFYLKKILLSCIHVEGTPIVTPTRPAYLNILFTKQTDKMDEAAITKAKLIVETATSTVSRPEVYPLSSQVPEKTIDSWPITIIKNIYGRYVAKLTIDGNAIQVAIKGALDIDNLPLVGKLTQLVAADDHPWGPIGPNNKVGIIKKGESKAYVVV